MAELKIDSNMTVAELKENFKKEFGGILRVKQGGRVACDTAKISEIRSNRITKEGIIECRMSRTVDGFEQEMLKEFGLKVRVATKDDWVAVLGGVTLASVKDIPNQSTRSQMEEFIAYKRSDNEPKSQSKETNENDTSKTSKHIILRISGRALTLNFLQADEEKQDLLELAEAGDGFGVYDIMDKNYKKQHVSYELADIDTLDDEDFALHVTSLNIDGNEIDSDEWEDNAYLDWEDIVVSEIESFKTDDSQIIEYINYLKDNNDCEDKYQSELTLFPLLRKKLTGEYYPQDIDNPTIFYGNININDNLEYKYEFDIPTDQEFDLSEVKLVANYYFNPTPWKDANEQMIGFIIYKNQLIQGTVFGDGSDEDNDYDPTYFIVEDQDDCFESIIDDEYYE